MITIVVNSAAGQTGGDDLAARITGLFAAAATPVRIVASASGADTAAAARAAVDDGAEAVVAVGGDGTVSTVASVLAGTRTALGILPLGTLNHFAKDLGIPLDLEPAVSVVVARHTRSVDVGDVNGRSFINNSSIGLYPDIVVGREALRAQGYNKWAALAVATLRIFRHYRGLPVKMTAGGETRHARTPFLMVGNNEYDVDGFDLGARHALDGGRLFVYLAPRTHGRELPKLLFLAVLGRARRNQALESFAMDEMKIETSSSRRLRVALDGEVVVMTTPLCYRIRPGALSVIVPAG